MQPRPHPWLRTPDGSVSNTWRGGFKRKPRIQVEQKKCTHCGQMKAASEYHRAHDMIDGLRSWCKACYRQRNREKQLDRQRNGERMDGTKALIGDIPRARGERINSTKLTATDVQIILQLLDELPISAIAEKFEVHYNTIYRIHRGETWAHVLVNNRTQNPTGGRVSGSIA